MPEMTYRIRNVIVAAVLAIAAVALTLVYISHARTSKQSKATGTEVVLVATRDIPVGTTGAQLAKSGWLTPMKFSTTSIASGAVSNPTQLAALVAIQATYKGEQIVARRFGTTQQEGILANLRGQSRVVELPGDAHQLLAGTLAVGNRVDVIGNVKNPETGLVHSTTVVLRNLLVVKAPGQPSSSNAGTSNLSVQLVLTGPQEDKLFWLEKNGDWSLVLRPSTGAKDATVPPTTSATLLVNASGH